MNNIKIYKKQEKRINRCDSLALLTAPSLPHSDSPTHTLTNTCPEKAVTIMESQWRGARARPLALENQMGGGEGKSQQHSTIQNPHWCS